MDGNDILASAIVMTGANRLLGPLLDRVLVSYSLLFKNAMKDCETDATSTLSSTAPLGYGSSHPIPYSVLGCK